MPQLLEGLCCGVASFGGSVAAAAAAVVVHDVVDAGVDASLAQLPVLVCVKRLVLGTSAFRVVAVAQEFYTDAAHEWSFQYHQR